MYRDPLAGPIQGVLVGIKPESVSWVMSRGSQGVSGTGQVRGVL